MPECDLWWRNPGAASDEIWTLIPDASGATVFHLAPFVSSEHHPRCAVRGRIERCAAPVPGTISLPSSTDHSVVAQSDYLETIRLALDSIANSDLQKVVLSRSDWWDESGDPESVFVRKCKEHPNGVSRIGEWRWCQYCNWLGRLLIAAGLATENSAMGGWQIEVEHFGTKGEKKMCPRSTPASSATNESCGWASEDSVFLRRGR